MAAATSNWGRWGPADELGTVNLMTAETRVRAAGLVRSGTVFDLGIPLGASGPQLGGARVNPILLMSQTGQGQHLPGGFHFADDYVFMPLQAATQWDALAHVYYDDQMWNGYPAAEITPRGAARNSIDRLSKGIVGRGVLADVAGHRQVDYLAAGEAIEADELEAVLTAQGVDAGPGDVLLVRTGWYARYLADGDRVAFMSCEPGLALSCARWLRERDIAVVASDNWGVEVFSGEDGVRTLELHMVLIRDMGMTLGELFDLDDLAAHCRAGGCWEFFFCGPPLKFSGAVGSPVNPLAIT
jgi:kynurenine formamidase